MPNIPFIKIYDQPPFCSKRKELSVKIEQLPLAQLGASHPEFTLSMELC